MMFDTKAFALKNKNDCSQHIIIKITCYVMQIETHQAHKISIYKIL